MEEHRRRLNILEEKISKLQIKMEDMRSTKADNLVKDPKSALRLPVCHPTIFSGETVNYIPWKRDSKATMGEYTPTRFSSGR